MQLCCPFEDRVDCLGACPWCPARDTAQVYDEARVILAVSIRNAGYSSDGGQRWDVSDFNLVRTLRGNCGQLAAMEVLQHHHGKNCDNGLRLGRVYVLSGTCLGRTFFADPCGVRLSLSDF